MMRVFAATLFALWTGVVFTASMFAIELWPEPIDELWYSAAQPLVTLVIAVAVGAYVGPWALVTALAPFVPAIPLQLAGHVAPWESAWRPLELAPWYTAILLVALAVGASSRHVAAWARDLPARR
jgi:hypothetical protein